MSEPNFFEVPIYRCTLSEHSKFMKMEEEKFAPIERKLEFPYSYSVGYSYFHEEKWFSWKYNEIIGYLNLYIFENQLRGDIWLIDNKRINKGIIKKKFIFRGKAFEKQIPKQNTSTEIFNFVIETVMELNRKDWKKFHFSLKTFKVIGQFVDWVELTKKLNSYSYPEHRRQYYKDIE